MIRTLLFSTLYPNSATPNHGIFVETRLRHLVAGGGIDTRVVAPVPWFPFSHGMFGRYGKFAEVPEREVLNGIHVEHPRYFLLPKVDTNRAPNALARVGLRTLRDIISKGFDFDIIDAHYYYPDGIAACIIGAKLNKPVVITARGSDINLLAQYPVARQRILDAVTRADATITVSTALKNAIVNLGGPAEKITVLRNGVDLTVFFPEDRNEARKRIGVRRYGMGCVGNLVENKGQHLAIEAMQHFPDSELFIAGGGVNESRLRRLAQQFEVTERVHFLGVLNQDRLRTLYSAIDCLLLPSVREGWPNVLLEAMACGTPVVASNVGGVPEIVAAPEAGQMMTTLAADALVDSIRRLRVAKIDRAATQRYASLFDWASTSIGQREIFTQVLMRRTSNA